MRASALLLAVFLCAAPSRAAGPQLSQVAEAQLSEGLLRLYSLDYVRSREAFRKIIESEPDNPFGYLFEAGGIWWQASQEYGLFKSTPALQGVFERDVEDALRTADAYIDSKDPRQKASGYFVSGMALGTRGQWSLMRGHYLDAYFDGRKAVKHLKKCLKIDESFSEAYLGLGVFDYQAAHLSGVAKLGILFGMKGDEKRGLERIQTAAEKSRYASAQAAGFLVSIYIIDMHDLSRALPVVQRMRRDFPSSPYYLFLELLLRHRLGDWDGSLRLGQEFYKAAEGDPAAMRPKWLTLICGLSGPDCLDPQDMERALEWIDHALDSTAKEPPSGFASLLRTFRGHILGVLGRRAQAEKEYRLALALPDFDDLHAQARACLGHPCGRADLLQYLKEMSRTD
ncbi:MAG: hypothetical protein A2506_07440 [Elusimicrobia bacterium RIFOXYD12_FULL_66_9]|nr:MAG: hypothetical protein A2506_07440 [Elusimicrobia bacterium RIFOXYD12_FULL_66_9]